MRAVAVMLALVSWVVPVRGQESPAEFTPLELSCRNATAARLVAFSDAAAECWTGCYARPNTSCYPYGPDPQTRDCLDRAEGRALSGVDARCAGFACPECYSNYGDCRSFDDDQMGGVESFIGQGLGLIFCNDNSSADGLSPAEARCQAGMAASGRRFGLSLARCFASCQARLHLGQITDPEACVAARINAPGFDAKTKACVDRVRAQGVARCGLKCADRPECLSLSCDGAIGALQSELFTHGDALFCVDQPPPVCGDARITQHEVCDPAAAPTGCPTPDYQCQSCNYCQAPYCGDGRVTTGEACDPNAYQSCSGDAYCGYDCRCHPSSCTSATDISSAGGTVYGVASSGPGTQYGSCGGYADAETAFRWTPSTSGLASVDTCGASFFGAMVYVRASSCTAGTEVACGAYFNSNLPACGQNYGGAVQFPATAGTAYYIFVDSYFGSYGNFQLHVHAPSASPSGAFVD